MTALLVLRKQSYPALPGCCAQATPITRRAKSHSARYVLRHDLRGHARRFSEVGAGRLNIGEYFVRLRP
jgi:hypothetical protein